jgi:hypothetical protein
MPEKKHQSLIVLITLLGGFVWMIILLFNSRGTPLHDEIGHFLISRDALHTTVHIFDMWGRTLNTLIYIIPAQFGLGAARFLSIIIALFTALLTLKIARDLHITYAFLAPFFLLAQPWYVDLSYLCITQVPFSLIMVAGTFLFLRNKRTGAALVIGLLPLIRHEGIALSGLMLVYLLYKKEWRSAFAVLIPLLIYNIAYFCFQGIWPFMLYFEAKPNNIYSSGTWYHFLIRLPHPRAVGIPVMILVTCSIIPLVKRIKNTPKLLLILVWHFSCFIVHSVIFRFGLFASGGYKLFLLPLAPVIAISAVTGLEWIVNVLSPYLKRFINSKKLLTPENIILVIFCCICLIFALVNVRPYQLDKQDVAIKKAAVWVREKNITKNDLIATHVFFYYFLPLKVPPVTLWEKFPPLSDMPSGKIIVWDNKYSNRWGLNYKILYTHPEQWEVLKNFSDGLVVIFRKK